eukprot:TRINITY_DN92442_c0_g1_i1.p1 TRINITY_DN92442_c0_g1~~TRINITY_DN92442_c0_g1_i1.p1  ORF type:complete len:874 (-),score=220.14 TRINITY_DN92442_c0_g1_i1:63-2684(-)
MTTPRPSTSPNGSRFDERNSSSASYSQSMAGRPNSRSSVQAGQEEGLETCKQAMALLVGDIRAEVQQAVASLKNEASSVTEGRFSQARQGQLAGKMVSMAENLQNAEKDALAKLRDLLKHTNWDMGDRMERQIQVHNQLGEHVNSSWDKLYELVTRMEMKLVTFESYITSSEERLSKQVSDMQTKMEKNVVSQIATETRRIMESSVEQFYDLKNALESTSNQTQTTLSEHIKSSGNKVTEALQISEAMAHEIDGKMVNIFQAQNSLESATLKIAADVSMMQRQDDRHYTDLGMSLESMKSDQAMRMSELDHAMNNVGKHMQPVNDNVSRVRRQVTNETKVVLAEIGKIQKALHVDYVNVKPGHQRQAEQMKPNQADIPDQELDDAEDLSKATRFRDFFVQTEHAAVKDMSIMTDPVRFEDTSKKDTKKKRKEPTVHEAAQEKMKKNAFGGADKLKEQATAAAMKKQYNVFDFYWEEGWAQRVARSHRFDNLTLSLVMVNSIWIAVDLDLNDADLIIDAHPIFIIAENFFCAYFFFEVVIRFLAFQKKKNAFKDAWFVFDFSLVSLMVMETWLLTIVLLASGSRFTIPGGTTMFRMIRLVRLLRLTRLTKLLRAVPELAIIMKGLAFASRSVAIFFVLWMVIVYIFSILFQQLLQGSNAGAKYFSTVPEGMNTLFLHGVLSGQAGVINEVTAGMPWLWPLIIFFMMLVGLTIMYMLLGVLVDVIGMVATSEKQKIEVSYIVGQLREELESMGHKDDMSITQMEFQNLITEPGIVKVMTEAGVDVVVLADMLELVFEDISNKGNGNMAFTDLVNIVLSMRGGNPATVKDCKEQIRVSKSIFKAAIEELTEELNEQFKRLRQDITALEVGDDDEED